MKFELAWASFYSFKHHFRIKPHALVLNFRASFLHEFARVGVEKVHAVVGENSQTCQVNRLEFVIAEHLGWLVAHAWLLERLLLWKFDFGA